MRIILGSDHAGFALKEVLIAYLRERGFEVEDKGPSSYDEADDYPDFTVPVARAVAEDATARGIIIGGSGQGEAIAANRIKGVRTTVYYGGNTEVLRIAREHNDANVLSLGARFMSEDEAKEAVMLWLETPFAGAERHIRRINKIDAA